MMRLRDRPIKGTALNLIAVAFNQGSTLIVNIIVTRILPKQNFGEYGMVQSTLLMVATLSQLATVYTAEKFSGTLKRNLIPSWSYSVALSSL
jgi:O-antigen/teichoic acid export membrane protein